MIEHELILLGLLHERPQHGYEIKKKIHEILFLFAGVDAKSVYYPLAVLEKRGFVLKTAGRQGTRPRRFVYYLTPKGTARFKELLAESFLDFKRPQFSLDLSLYFLDAIAPSIAHRRLRARMNLLEKLSRNLRHMRSSIPVPHATSIGRILEHNLQMVETESHFLSGLVSSLE